MVDYIENNPDFVKLVLSNVSEYDIRLMDSRMPDDQRELWRLSAIKSSDVSLFWDGDHKIVITPEPIDKIYLDYIRSKLRYENVINKSPVDSTGILSRDVLEDSTLLASLKETFSNKRIQIIPWGASPWIYELINHFRSLNMELITSEIPSEINSWTVDYFGSKSGFRKACLEMGSNIATRIPQGICCSGADQVIDIVRDHLNAKKGVVIKADYGVGGDGTFIIPASKINSQNTDKLINEIRTEISQWKIYDLGFIVVEEYIEKSARYPDGSIDIYINMDGSVKIYDPCLMHVTENRFFGGVLYGPKILPDSLASILVRVASKIGEHISKRGYRGWFDIDFMVSKSGEIFLNEFNLRRNSGHYVKGIMDRFQYIYDIPASYGISEETVTLAPKTSIDIRDVIKVFDEIQKDNKYIKFLAVPIMVHHLMKDPPKIGFVVVSQQIQSLNHIKDELYKNISARFGILRR